MIHHYWMTQDQASMADRIIIDQATTIGSLFRFFGLPKRGGMYRVGDLITLADINPKSKHKPVEYPKDDIYEPVKGVVYSKLTELNEDMRKEVNYGHKMVAYPNAVEAIRGVAEGSNFVYERPSTWSRLKDFFGYNDDASNWHEVQTSISKVNRGSSVEVRISDLEAMFTLGEVVSKGLNLYTANLGFLMWNAAFSAEQGQVYFLSLTDMREAGKQLVDIKDELRISTENIGEGIWYMYPCITNVLLSKDSMVKMRGDGEYEGVWIPLPYCNTHSIEVVMTGGDDNIIGFIELEKTAKSDITLLDAASLAYTMSTLTISFTNTGETSYTFSFDTAIHNSVPLSGEFDFSGQDITIEAGQTLSFTWELKEDVYRFMVYETPVQLEVTYYMTVEGKPQSITTTIDLTTI